MSAAHLRSHLGHELVHTASAAIDWPTARVRGPERAAQPDICDLADRAADRSISRARMQEFVAIHGVTALQRKWANFHDG